jgi:CTP synthase (UTP-ammonia lyase)
MPTTMVALVGDYSPEVIAHRAIPVALERARAELSANVHWRWVSTRELTDAPRQLANDHAVWLVPASPYANMAGALAAVRFARESGRPFLGTCGGFQHALIEIARDLAGILTADHAETNPAGDALIVAPLQCPLVEKSAQIHFRAGSRLRNIYAAESALEGYHCSYGLNAAYRETLEHTGLQFTAFDDAGEIRGAELPTSVHPFFLGTLFQPERAALAGRTPPLAKAFVEAAIASR